ncbi:MAG: hypothetical protein HYV07_01195 [Deltaproteobacteria bacterium]|nr:hypothetical protein [Deltaproteobacteria bacterium]
MLDEGAGRGFWLAVVASVFIHGVAGGAIVWAQSKQPAPIRFIESMPVQLVKLGKKRDPELLPRLVEPPPPPPAPEGISLAQKDPSKDRKADKKPEKKVEKRELSSAAQRLLDAQPSAMERALAKVETDEGDPEGDVAGTTTDPAQAAAGYQKALIIAIRREYVLPEAIPPSQRSLLRARVWLVIAPSGAITEFKFTESHPNTLFTGALEKLLQTVKLPSPPSEIAQTVGKDGVELVFRP